MVECIKYPLSESEEKVGVVLNKPVSNMCPLYVSYVLLISHFLLLSFISLSLSLAQLLSLTHSNPGQICSFIYSLADLGWNVDECLKISVVK